MANCKFSPREFIQRSFSPMIAVFCSDAVNKICQKNNLSLTQLLQPFCTLDKEVNFKDPSGTIISIKSFHIFVCDINSQPPDAIIARKLLNQSVGREFCDETVTVKANALDLNVPTTVPWFDSWRETFLQVQFPSDHEFTKHYVACILVTSTIDDDPLDALSNMGQHLQQMLGVSPTNLAPKWFSSSILRYYVLVHDFVAEDVTRAQKVYEEMKLTYKSQRCHMLQINSKPISERSECTVFDYWSETLMTGANLQDIANDANVLSSYEEVDVLSSVKAEVDRENVNAAVLMNSDMINHPLSPQLESQRVLHNQKPMNGSTDQMENNVSKRQHAMCLNEDDVSRIKNMVLSFVVDALLPFVETQMQYLNEMVSNKKGVSKSFFNTTKRWFGTSKPSSPTNTTNVIVYGNDSPELQMRRLGDLCFMFCAYTYAFQVYHTAKRDFESDGALLHFAGALEMAALSSFLIGLDIKKAQDYAEKSIVTYMHSCRMPQFATRVTLCTSDCLKDLGLYGEAAKHLIQMTSEDSDLRSALLLEQASYCFIKSKKPCMPRKYAFHLVLAGHRFSKAGQKRHSLRCYQQAYQVYEGKDWSLAEDHIHFTIGRLATTLNENNVTISEFAKLFTHPSRQRPAQQTAFLKEYIVALNEFIQNRRAEGDANLPCLEIPRVDNSSINVMLDVTDDNDVPTGLIAASGVTLSQEDTSSNCRWWQLEEKLVSYANNGSLPLLFKPSVSFLSNYTNNSTKPVTVIGESIDISVVLINLLNIPVTLQNIHLMWCYSSTCGNDKQKGPLAQIHSVPLLILDPDSSTQVLLNIIPRAVGELHVAGICYSVLLTPTVDGGETLSVTGYQNLKPQSAVKTQPELRKSSTGSLPDYRLQFNVIDSAPCLRVYFENLPSELLCGEIYRVTIHLYNVGILPISRVLLTSAGPCLISMSSSSSSSTNNNNCTERFVHSISLNSPLQPGQSEKVEMYVRGADVAGHYSIDLLFFYDTGNAVSSHPKLKYRLVYHSSHVFIRSSIHVTAKLTRSLALNDQNNQILNVQLQTKNTHQHSSSVVPKICLHQVSMYSKNWELYDTVTPIDSDLTNLGSTETAFLLLKVRRKPDTLTSQRYSDLCLNSSATIPSNEKPYKDFIKSTLENAVNNNNNSNNYCGNAASHKWNAAMHSKNEHENENPLDVNILLIVMWKTETKRNNKVAQTIVGQHHVWVKKLGEKYSTPLAENESESSSNAPTPGPSLVSKIYDPTSVTDYGRGAIPNDASSSSDLLSSLLINKQLVLVKLKYPHTTAHPFISNRICFIRVVVMLQNCSDFPLEVRMEAVQKPAGSAGKTSSSSNILYDNFTWLGVVQKLVKLEQHKEVAVHLSAGFTTPGTYDLGSRLTVSARKLDTDEKDEYFYIQSSKPSCLIFITNKSSS